MFFKVNCDGAVFSKSHRSGLGVVIRNSNGQVIASLTQQLNQAYKPIEVEAMAAIRALEFAAELGLDRVVVEGDSSIVMTVLKTKDLGLASYGLQRVHFSKLIFRIILLSYYKGGYQSCTLFG